MQIEGQLTCASRAKQKLRFTEVSAPPSYEGKSATGLATGYPPKGLTVLSVILTRDKIRSNDRGWSQWAPSAEESMKSKCVRSEGHIILPALRGRNPTKWRFVGLLRTPTSGRMVDPRRRSTAPPSCWRNGSALGCGEITAGCSAPSGGAAVRLVLSRVGWRWIF
jgi:hypothetical protein